MKNRCIRVEDEVWDQWRGLAESKGVSVVDVLRSAMDKEAGFTCPECGGSGVVAAPKTTQSKPVKQKVEQPVEPIRNTVVETKPPHDLTQKPLPPTSEKQPSIKPQTECIECGVREGYQKGEPSRWKGNFGWLCTTCSGHNPSTETRGRKEHAA